MWQRRDFEWKRLIKETSGDFVGFSWAFPYVGAMKQELGMNVDRAELT